MPRAMINASFDAIEMFPSFLQEYKHCVLSCCRSTGHTPIHDFDIRELGAFTAKRTARLCMLLSYHALRDQLSYQPERLYCSKANPVKIIPSPTRSEIISRFIAESRSATHSMVTAAQKHFATLSKYLSIKDTKRPHTASEVTVAYA